MGRLGSVCWAIPNQGHAAKTALVAPALLGGRQSGLGHLSGPVDHPVGISPCLCTFNDLGYCVLDTAVSQDCPNTLASCG